MKNAAKKISWLTFLTLFCFPCLVFASDEEKETNLRTQKAKLEPILVTATRTEESIEEIRT